MRGISCLLKAGALLGWGICVLGCGGSQKAPTPAVSVRDPQVLYPLRSGAAWSYDVSSSENQGSTLAVTRVIQVKDGKVEVTNGAESIMYELRPQGIFKTHSQSWLLKAPIDVGASWPSSSDMTAKVTAVDKTVETFAGKFTQCVEVVEHDFFGSRMIESVYCPSVGPVSIEVVTAKLREHPTLNKARVTAKLRGFRLNAD